MSHPRVENYSYDSQTGLLTGQTVKNSAATSTYLDLTYSYARGSSHGSVNGKTGQLTKIVDNLNRNRDKLYEFDSVGRLMKAYGGLAAGATGVTANWTQTYTYDRYGNKTATSVSGDLEDTTRAPRDGLSSVSVNTANNRVNTSGWEYDLAGNLIRGKDGTAWQKFEYDAAGRLVKIKNDSNVLLEEYTYGASRERLKVETSSSRRYFAWGGQNVVAEYTETGSGTTPEYSKSYIYAGSRLFMTATKASSTTETKEFHHPDRLGTQLVTDSATGSSFRQSTMPFGTSISTETTGNTNQVFTSYDRSSTTGLDYAQNRTYSKGQSRFTQVDPIGMSSCSLSKPQSKNLYAYVQNMPTDSVDPRGMTIQMINGNLYDCYTVSVQFGNFISSETTCERLTYWGGGNQTGSTFEPWILPESGGGTPPNQTPPGTPDKKKEKAFNDCVKSENRKCENEGRAYFNDNFYTTLLVGPAAQTLVTGGWAAAKKLGWRAIATMTAETIVLKAGPYVAVAAATLAVRDLTNASVAIENACKKNVNELCKRRAGLL